MSNILEKICADKRVAVNLLKRTTPLDSFREQIIADNGGRFKESLQPGESVNIIAEIKKASPSRGVLIEDFDVSRLAGQYAEGGAVALSVLTEQNYFQGDAAFMKVAAEASGLPILCKDFVVDSYQLFYARWMGADALLLIAALYDNAQLTDLLAQAKEIGLECLVEVHNESELQTAVRAGVSVVGINNRDLTNFEVDLEVSERLSSQVPDDVIKVSESGIWNGTDISRLKRAGFNSFLIGEALVRADDPVALLKKLATG